jgi:hypothetical protein
LAVGLRESRDRMAVSQKMAVMEYDPFAA